jgi:hypothetical protein
MSRVRRDRRAPKPERFAEPFGRLVWLVPVFVFLLVSVGVVLRQLDYLTGAGIGVVVVVIVARRPDWGLLGLVAFLPFQTVVFALLFHFGLSLQITRQAGSWKEGLAIGVAIAGFIGFRKAKRKLDLLDMLALAFIGLALAFAMFPQLFADTAPGASNVRSLAFRQTAGFVILLLGARHADLRPEFGRRAAKVVMFVGTIVAIIAIYEFFFSDSFNRFVVETVELPKYKYDIFQIGNPFETDVRYYGSLGGVSYTRVGSILFSPLVLGFYLLLPFAFAIERTVRDGLRSLSGAVLALTGIALIFTQTRAAIIGALVIALIAVRPAAGKTTDRRLQYGFVITIIVFLALPVAAYSGLTERSTSVTSGDEQSAFDHWDALVNGIRGVGEHPLGMGIGTSAGVGQRFSTTGAFITENYYLQMGIELGIVGLILFLALTIVLIRYMNRAAKKVPDLPLGAMRLATIGLAVGAALLHTWTDFAVAWSAWGLAGGVLGYAERQMRGEGVDDEGAAPTVDELPAAPLDARR